LVWFSRMPDESPPANGFFFSLGSYTLQVLHEMGAIVVFFITAVLKLFHWPVHFGRIIEHVHFIGVRSLFVVALTGLFTGMVLGIQGYYTLVKFGSETVLGLMVALSLIRELGPVLTALMITGRAGSSIAAEIGIMRISEQIDALDTMNIDPMRFLVSPRLVAAVISFPLLTAIFDVIGIIGGYITGVMMLGINSGTYVARMEMGVEMVDVRGGFIKSFFFALIVMTVCCYQGYTTDKHGDGHGARGVGSSTTTAVVMSSVLVLIADYVITSFLMGNTV